MSGGGGAAELVVVEVPGPAVDGLVGKRVLPQPVSITPRRPQEQTFAILFFIFRYGVIVEQAAFVAHHFSDVRISFVVSLLRALAPS